MDNIKIIFLGDITGKQGRLAVKSFLSDKQNVANFVIANVENASHGFGLTKKNYNDLANSGIDCFTSGNHIWDKRDIYEYINESENLVRPINYPVGTPGVGAQVFNVKNYKIGVINALGRVFMSPIDSPWEVVPKKIDELIEDGVDSIFIDFHAEATAEKICFAKYLSNKYNTEKKSVIKGFFGTHTHVQTADEQIMNGMAYITDAGFCGAADSVIGMEFETSCRRLTTCLPERYEISENSIAQINGVEILIDNGIVTHIKRISKKVDNKETEASLDTSS